MEAVRGLVAANPGGLPVQIRLAYVNGTVVTLELADGVNPSDEFLSGLGKIAAKDKWNLDVKPDIFAEKVGR